MKEKYSDLLEQYDIEILSTFRNRGTFQCETDQGLLMLKEYHHSPERLALEHEWKKQLSLAGYTHLDSYLETKEGSLLVHDKYHTPFVLKHYTQGKECDCRSLSDVGLACSNLGLLHQASVFALDSPELSSELIPAISKYSSHAFSIEDLFSRRTKELKRIRRFLSKVKHKNCFELSYIAHFEDFFEETKNAYHTLERINDSLNTQGELPNSSQADKSPSANVMDTLSAHLTYGICHGAYHYHNILILPDRKTTTVHFESICYQPYLTDLYLFLRKTLEKNHYDFAFFETGIRAYAIYRPLSSYDYLFLYLLFLYPEKFWKISNQYYNHRKSWISPNYEEKLQKLLISNRERLHFLKKLKEYITKTGVLFQDVLE